MFLSVFLLKKLKKKESQELILLGEKQGGIAGNMIKGRVEILETDEIMTIFPQRILFNNR